MATKDSLGDRMKRYEMEDADDRLMPLLPIIARMDGRAFHTFTKGLHRPYDASFSQCMIETTIALVKEFHADLGYTQSDEISLYWCNDDYQSQMLFDGRKHKFIGATAAEVTGSFLEAISKHLPHNYLTRRPRFDSRVFQVPNTIEAYNYFVWREADATKNSLSMAAQSRYSQEQLHKKAAPELHDLLYQKGINWNNYPAYFKRGTYVCNKVTYRERTEAELSKVPAIHRHLHMGPIMRPCIGAMDVPPITSIYPTQMDRSQILHLMVVSSDFPLRKSILE